jgi:aspartate kinase
MENSAISFSIVFDQDDYKMSELLKQLGPHYITRYNTQLQLMTVRHGNESIVAQVSAGKELLLEQRSRQTTRLLMRM